MGLIRDEGRRLVEEAARDLKNEKAALAWAAPLSPYRIWRGKIPHFPATFFGGVPSWQINELVPTLGTEGLPHGLVPETPENALKRA